VNMHYMLKDLVK